MRDPADQPAAVVARLPIRPDSAPEMIRSLRALAQAMLAMTDESNGAGPVVADESRRKLGQIARMLHRERLRRADFFPADLFAEPAWDILLDLYAAKRAAELRSIKAVCLASQVPEATALRYIELLGSHGLVERSLDRTDRRRKYLALTPLGERKMHNYLASMPAFGDFGEDLLRSLIQAR